MIQLTQIRNNIEVARDGISIGRVGLCGPTAAPARATSCRVIYSGILTGYGGAIAYHVSILDAVRRVRRLG